MIMIMIIINATWTSVNVPRPPRCEVCVTPGTWQERQGASEVVTHGNYARTGNAGRKLCSQHSLKCLKKPSLESTWIIQTPLWLAGSAVRQGRAGRSRRKQQEPQQSWPRKWLLQSWHRGRREKAAGVMVRMGGHREIWGRKCHCPSSQLTFHPKNTGNNCTWCSPPQNRASFIPANMNTLGKRIIETTLEGFRKRKIL